MRTAVLDILRIDLLLFEYDDTRPFVIIFEVQKGTILREVGPFNETRENSGTQKPEDFIEFLGRVNLDPMRVARVNDKPHIKRMGERQRWLDFLAFWSNKLTEARRD